MYRLLFLLLASAAMPAYIKWRWMPTRLRWVLKFLIKGQTNSKWFFQADDFSKKRTKEFSFLALQNYKRIFRLFFGGI